MNRIAQRAATGAVALGLLVAGAGFAGCGSDDVNDAVNDAQKKLPDDAQKSIDKAQHKANKAIDKAQNKADKAIDDAGDTANDAIDDAGDSADDAVKKSKQETDDDG